MKCFKKPFVTLYFVAGSFTIAFCQSEKLNPPIIDTLPSGMNEFVSSVMDDCPTSLVINPLESCGDYSFTLGEGQPNEDVYWYFDDGSYIDHVGYSIEHHYSNQGSYSGYARYSSDLCSTTTYNFLLMVPSCSTTATMDFELEELLVYPNPVVNKLYLSGMPDGKELELDLVNISGKKIETFVYSNKQVFIDLAAVPKGIYFLDIIDNNSRIRKRIVIE